MVLAVLYFRSLTVEKYGATVRHVVTLVLGVLVGLFSFGW